MAPNDLSPAAIGAGLARALDGGAPLVLADLDDPALVWARDVVASPDVRDAGAALVLATSGSTSGTSRLVALTADAVRASATATHAALGGPGSWLLTLPAHHVAGVMVTARALLAGTTPTHATPGPFRPSSFASDAERHLAERTSPRSYTSLVPTQLLRVLQAPRARAALARFDAVLVGGAATPPGLLERAAEAGVRAVTTYGMTETSGGCVYDGVPLDGVGVGILEGTATDGDVGAPAPLPATGRIVLTGPQLALGYLTPDGIDPIAPELTTNDRGTWDGHRLRVLGRADDVIVSGGVNVEPSDVETVAVRVPGVAELCVVGVADAEWGESVAAAVVPSDPAVLGDPARTEHLTRALQDAVRAELGGPWVPRRITVVDALPLRGPGKPDRPAIRALLAP